MNQIFSLFEISLDLLVLCIKACSALAGTKEQKNKKER